MTWGMVHGDDLLYSNFRVIGRGAPSARANVCARPPYTVSMGAGKSAALDEIRSNASPLPGSYLGNRESQRHGTDSDG